MIKKFLIVVFCLLLLFIVVYNMKTNVSQNETSSGSLAQPGADTIPPKSQ